MKKSNALIKSLPLFPARYFIMHTALCLKKTIARISNARFVFNQILSRCVINRRQNRELENTKKKTTSVDEKENDEVKLHAALVLNMTYWVIYEPRRDT